MSLPDYASQILDAVRSQGAEADLIVNAKTSLSLKARDGKLDEQAVSDTRVLGLRVIKDQRVGIAYSEATDPDALTHLVEQALLNARFNQPAPHEQIAANAQTLHTDDAQLCPDSSFSTEQRIDLALYLERELAARPNIRNVPNNGVQESISQASVYSTQGLVATSRQRMNALYAFALAADGDLTAMSGTGQVVRLGEHLNADSVIEEAHREATALLRGEPVPSGAYDVIFDRDNLSAIFNAFGMMWSGKAAQDGVNPWRDQVGQSVASAQLNISDQPLDTDGFGYALFDAEGTATAPTLLIMNGVLHTLMHNTVTASALGTESTGHAQRGPRSPLSVGEHQLEIAPGKISTSDLTAGEYLEITALQGTHSGANALSGDFSFGASGYLCRDGERQRPVRGITVAGNFYQLLTRIDAIGNRAEWTWQKGLKTPLLRFGAVAISG